MQMCLAVGMPLEHNRSDDEEDKELRWTVWVFMCMKEGQMFFCFFFQDVECDVSLEDDNRQEWIFTLYDFDNSGKVTKEVCGLALPLATELLLL